MGNILRKRKGVEMMNTAEKYGMTGELPPVELADLLQIQNKNKFTGALSIQQGQRKGIIYFEDGEVVHGEYSRWAGQTAVYLLLGLGQGEFSCQIGLCPPKKTIEMGMTQLLLEAHRWLDELSETQRQVLFKEKQEPDKKINRLVKKLLPIQGVDYAVLFDENGQPHDDDSDASIRLAAQGGLIRENGIQLGAALGLSDFRGAMLTGGGGHMLLIVSPLKSMILSINRLRKPYQVEAAVRNTLLDH